jgi:hypothetical protein
VWTQIEDSKEQPQLNADKRRSDNRQMRREFDRITGWHRIKTILFDPVILPKTLCAFF